MADFYFFLSSNRSVIHLILHVLVPLIVSRFASKPWLIFTILIATMLVDVDHLLADPLYDPNRCSIGFHPLHSFYLQPVYILMSFYPKTRWIGVGLVIHMILDAFDCFWMNYL